MIARRTNTFYSFQAVPPDCSAVNGRYIAPERVPYFRSLWRRRGQWISLPVLMADARETGQLRATNTIKRLGDSLPAGFSIETKRETVFPNDPVLDADTLHTYYRLLTDETLPSPTFTGEAALADTEPTFVPLEEAETSPIL